MASKKGKRQRKRSRDSGLETADGKTVEVVDGAQGTGQEAPKSETSGGDEADQAVEEMDEVTRLECEVAEWKDKFLRAKADQKNAARRAANELEDSIRYANGNLLKALLEVVDDFERMAEATRGPDTAAAVLDGMTLVREKVEKLLKDHRVECIEAENTPFDPAKHEALMQQPSLEHEPGTVVQQIQKGYLLRERVLRPAKVIVAVAPAEDGAPPGGEPVSESEEA